MAGLQVAAIGRSTSSTAAVGYFFVPFFAVAAFVFFFIFGFCIGLIRQQIAQGRRKNDLQMILPALLVISMAGFFMNETFTGIVTMQTVAEVERAQSGDQLKAIFDQSMWGRNKFVLGAIAQKEIATAEILDQIAHLQDPELQEAMGSLLPVMGNNGKGLAVMRLVVNNPHVSPETVEYLAASSQDLYVLGDIAGSRKTSLATLRKLAEKKNYLVDWGLAQNLMTPPDVFALLLERMKDANHRVTLEMLERNPSVPADVREKAQVALKTWH